ncbi:hypothetical protein HY523_01590, partial [Candidatus Berkelbacteria bacterium]|nr:hypothetical protein [Candidatus Berkelbacteria bacterium]
ATACQLAHGQKPRTFWIKRADAQPRNDLCRPNRQATKDFIDRFARGDRYILGNSPTILLGIGFWLSQTQTILSQPTLSPEQRNQLSTDVSLMKQALSIIQQNQATPENLVQLNKLHEQLSSIETQYRTHPANQQPRPPQATFAQQVRPEWRMLPGVKIIIKYTGPNAYDTETITTVVDKQKYRSNLSPAVVSPSLDTFLFNPGGGSVTVTIQLPDGQSITSTPLKNQSDWTKFIGEYAEKSQNRNLFGPDGKAILHGFLDDDGQFKTLAEAEEQWRRVVNVTDRGINLAERFRFLTAYDPVAFLRNREVILKSKSEGEQAGGARFATAYVYLPLSTQTSDFYACPLTGLSARYPAYGYLLMNEVVVERITRYTEPVFCGNSLAAAQEKAIDWLAGQKKSVHAEVSPGTIGPIEQYERGLYLRELAAVQNELAAVEGELTVAGQSRGYEVLGLTRSLQLSSEFRQTADRGTSWLDRALAAEVAPEEAAPTDETEPLVSAETNYLRVAFQGVPALLTVTDPLGRSVGINPLTNLPLSQVPAAIVGGSGSPHTTIFLPEIVKGEYTVVVTPLADGEGTLWTESSIGGSEPEQTVVTKTVQMGSPQVGTVTIDFETEPTVGLDRRLRNHFLSRYRQNPAIWWAGGGLFLLGLMILSLRWRARRHQSDRGQRG